MSFSLWLEFEMCEPNLEEDLYENFFNMHVNVSDGSRYALNVWTFKVIEAVRYPWPY